MPVVEPAVAPPRDEVEPLVLPVVAVEPLPCRVVPEPFGAVVPADVPAGLPICAPVFAPGAVGSHGARGVELCPVGVPCVVVEPRGCVWVVVPRVDPVLCAMAGVASAAANAAAVKTVVSALFFMYGFPAS